MKSGSADSTPEAALIVRTVAGGLPPVAISADGGRRRRHQAPVDDPIPADSFIHSPRIQPRRRRRCRRGPDAADHSNSTPSRVPNVFFSLFFFVGAVATRPVFISIPFSCYLMHSIKAERVSLF